MNRKIILLIDMDGVVAQWYPGLVQKYQAKYPGRPVVPPEEVTEFYVEGFYPEEHREDLLQIARTKGFYRELPLMEGAQEALKDIEENCLDFIDPFICTAPELDFEDLMCHSEKVQYVQEHFGDFWAKQTIITKDKTLVFGDYLIDDKPRVKGVRIPDWQQIHYAQPYNRGYINPDCKIADYQFTWADWQNLKMDLYNESGARKFLI